MIANVTCQKCGSKGKFDVGNVSTVEAAQDKVNGAHMQSCPFGNHVELTDIHYVVESLEEGSAMSEDEFVAKMEADGYDLWTTDELYESPIEITSFAYGLPMANINGQSVNLDFVTSPSGKRYYYMNHEEYERLVAASR